MASNSTACTIVSLVNLNTDVLFEIFSYLDLASLKSIVCTCNVFKAVGYDPLLWSGTNIVKIRRGEDITQSLAESFRDRKLRIFMFSDLDYESVEAFNRPLTINRPLLEGLRRCLEIAEMDTLFLAELRQPVIVSTSMSNSFKNLRCLVLEKRWSYDELAVNKINDLLQAALKQLDNLEQFVIRFAIRGNTRSYPNNPFQWHMLNYVRVIIDSLPRLRDLEVIRPRRYPPHRLSYPDIAYDSAFSADDTRVIPGLRRLSITQFYIDGSLFTNPHRYPNVEHLALNFHGLPLISIGNTLERMPHLKSLQMTKINFTNIDLPRLNNLQALRITPQFTDHVSEKLCSLTKLQVLDLDLVSYYWGHDCEDFTNWCIRLLRLLSNLKILIFTGLQNGVFFYLTHDHQRLKQCVKEIHGYQSIIGLDFSADLKSLPSTMQYVTVRKNGEHSLRHLMRTCSGWRHVDEHSKAWHKAHGTHYFIPANSYPSPSDIQKFQEQHTEDVNLIKF